MLYLFLNVIYCQDLYELFMKIENELNTKIPDEQARKLTSTAGLIGYVEKPQSPSEGFYFR